MLSGIRRSKEYILYFIVTVICLESVRVKFNLLEDKSRKEGWGNAVLQEKRRILIRKASLLYGIFVALMLVNIPISLTDKITSVYPDTMLLKNNIALLIVLVLTYVASVLISKALLLQYIKKMNTLTGFWKKLGRSAWDGTKIAAHAPIKAGGVVFDKVVKGTRSGMNVAGRVGRFSKDSIKKGVKSGGEGLSKFGQVLRNGSKKTADFISRRFKRNDQ